MKFLSKMTSLLLAGSMAVACLPNIAFGADKVNLTSSGPWFECAYATWDAVSGASDYNVYYKLATEADYKKADEQLVRDTRVDLVGLMGDKTYNVKVVPVMGSGEDESKAAAFDVTPYTPEEVGYAFQSDATWTTGGYNRDGSIPDNATIFYLDKTNIDTVTLDYNGKQYVGMEKIINFIQKNYIGPIIFRISGEVTDFGKMNGNVCTIHNLKDVTFEGIGPDAGFKTMGLDISTDAQNVEVRNLYFKDFADDGLSIRTNARRVFVHNCTFGYGYDGACDVKIGMGDTTISYNHVDKADKAMLCGHSDGQTSDIGNLTVTYYQNFFDGTKQRNPRVRFGKVHVLNNYYNGITLYGAGSAMDAHVLVEGNYFYNSARPYVVSQKGDAVTGDKVTESVMMKSKPGYLKAVNNYIDPTCTHYSSPENVNENGFDFDPHTIYTYTAKTPEQAKEDAVKYAGTVLRATGATDAPAQPTTQETTTQATTQNAETSETTTMIIIGEGMRGDVNGDKVLTAADSSKVLAYVLDSDKNPLLCEALIGADADANGEITASDAAVILAKVLNSDFAW